MKEPEEVDYVPPDPKRATKSVDLRRLNEIHKKLRGLSIAIDPELSSEAMRAKFSEIRDARNKVSQIFGIFLPRVARYKGDLILVEGALAGESAVILKTRRGLSLHKTERAKTAAIRVVLDDHHLMRDALKWDLLALEAVVAHTRHVQDELRSCFEEVSRALTTRSLEWSVQNRLD